MSLVEISINDAVTKVATSPAPILFPDTCALVDIIRMPFRIKSANDANRLLNAAGGLVTLSHTPSPDLWVIIPPLVNEEWNEHNQSTLQELEKHFRKLDIWTSVAHASANSVGVNLANPVMFHNQDIAKNLTILAGGFFNNAIALSEDTSCINKAYNRVKNNTPPARRGGQLKDSAIVEHVLEFCSLLRAGGYNNTCVFITSNTNDFCEPNSGGVPKEPLKSEFQSVNLSLVTNWDWGKTTLGV